MITELCNIGAFADLVDLLAPNPSINRFIHWAVTAQQL